MRPFRSNGWLRWPGGAKVGATRDTSLRLPGHSLCDCSSGRTRASRKGHQLRRLARPVARTPALQQRALCRRPRQPFIHQHATVPSGLLAVGLGEGAPHVPGQATAFQSGKRQNLEMNMHPENQVTAPAQQIHNPNQSAPLGNETRVLVVVEAFATTDSDPSPQYAVLPVDEAFARRVRMLALLCRQHDLSEVRCAWSPQWLPVGSALRLRLEFGELVVGPSGAFHCCETPQEAGYYINTRMISVEELDGVLDKSSPGQIVNLTGDEDALELMTK